MSFSFPSTIVAGSTSAAITFVKNFCHQLQLKYSANNPDIFIINTDTGWGIDQIRSLQSFFSRQPFSAPIQLAVIFDAHQLKTESQNALLKTLEEPGEKKFIILTTTRPSALLPTIISRCRLVHLTSPPVNTTFSSLPKSLLDILAYSEKIAADKEKVLPFLEDQIIAAHRLFLQDPKQYAPIISRLSTTISMVRANVDPRSALDYFLLSDS